MDYISCIFWAAEAIMVPIFIKSGWPDNKRYMLPAKIICATLFLGYAVYNLSLTGGSPTSYQIRMILGLVGGWFGDLFLTLETVLKTKKTSVHDAFSLTGGAAFFAGHIFYIFAFLSVGFRVNLWFFVLFGGVFALLMTLQLLLKANFGKFTVPVIFYALMLSFMFASGLTTGLHSGTTAGVCILGIGVFLFLISDFTLGLWSFGGKRFRILPVRILYLTAYFVAQMLLALSLRFV